ncbi:spermatogenesis-associated protein 45 isoform X1 [Pteropus medius]|uniref:spermatogenesis-associated protein 45 isoform X1 n=1 Tax=Pteropus vampyrus TaxID=132908 RepID=UPI00196A8394|nr:spermatogenesis-associated protein 45 isoform X1 [Pteropus giganteus]
MLGPKPGGRGGGRVAAAAAAAGGVCVRARRGDQRPAGAAASMPRAAAGRAKGERRPELRVRTVPEISGDTAHTAVSGHPEEPRPTAVGPRSVPTSLSPSADRPPSPPSAFTQEWNTSFQPCNYLERRLDLCHRASRTPRGARPHCCGASRGGGGCCCWAWGWGCWGCCDRPLIPCPILECYSVTYNRVTRAAADVPNASIGHRNKEGRVRDSGLYNPELRDALIGSAGSRAGGERSRGSCAATRNPIAVVPWEPLGAGAFVLGT